VQERSWAAVPTRKVEVAQMVHRLVVSYGQPTDPEAFDAYYRQVHDVQQAS
jgi:hypothetical protein